jgi:hypothetical protein
MLIGIFISNFSINAGDDELISYEKKLEQTQIWLKKLGLTYSLDDLKKLTWLDLKNSDIKDNQLIHLISLKSLQKLDLRETSISERGLHHIENLKNLSVLWLEGTPISDLGIVYLKNIQSLKELYLPTNISDKALEELKNHLPGSVIEREGDIFTIEVTAYIFLGAIIILVLLLSVFKAKHIEGRGGRIVFGVGILFYIAFIILLIDAIHFLSISKISNGLVKKLELKYHSSSDGGDSAVYHPRVSYMTDDGRKAEFISDMGSRPASYEVGEPVKVIYNPERPDRAEIYTFWGIFTVFSYALVMVIFGTILTFTTGGMRPLTSRIKKVFKKVEKR